MAKTYKISIWRRALWHLNRTPVAHVIKGIRRAVASKSVGKRRRFAATIASTPAEVATAEQLNREGYAIVTEAMDPLVLQSLYVATADLHERAKSRAVKQDSNHKDFWTRLLDEEMQDGKLPTDNPFAAFALQPAVLSILSRAYGELPHLDYVLLTLSRDTGKELSFSQLWHRDHDDTRVIKLFVYLTDVASLDDGPLTFIPGPASDRFGFSLHSQTPDAVVSSRVSSDEVQSLILPKLSVFMVETSRCLHMGSRLSPGHERLLYTATFISVPRLFPEPAPRFSLTGRESEVVRCVLSPV
jgi:hypothetical protein